MVELSIHTLKTPTRPFESLVESLTAGQENEHIMVKKMRGLRDAKAIVVDPAEAESQLITLTMALEMRKLFKRIYNSSMVNC